MSETRPPKRKKGEQRQGACVYCGAYGPITREHIFPQMLFRELDPQMLTAPGCSTCQQNKSLGEKDLRVYVNTDMLGSLHPDAEFHMKELFDSSEATAAWLERSVESSQPVPLRSDSNTIEGFGWSIEFNFSRIITTMEMIARALYFQITKRILPVETPISVMAVPWEHFPDHMKAASRIARISGQQPIVKGDKVAWYLPHLPVDAGEESIGITVCFNDHVGFELATGTIAEIQSKGRAEGQRKIDQIKERGYLLGPTQPEGVRLPKDRLGRTFVPPA